MRFFPAFLVHWRVVGALLLREMLTRFGKNKIGYLWALIEPALHISTFILIFSFMGRSHIGGMPLPTFFMTGIVTWFLFSNTYNKVLVAISANTNLLAYPQVSPYDIIVSRIVLEYATSVSVMVVMSLGFAFVGIEINTATVIYIPVVMLCVALFGAGVGMVVCAVKYYFESVDKIIGAILRLVYFTCGIFFLISAMPESLRGVLMLNPLVHAIDLVRTGYFDSFSNDDASLLYVVQFALGLLFCGLVADRLTRGKVRSS